MFFVIPLRKYYILKQKLVFPTPTATAFTIRALHASKGGAETAAKKTKALIVSFAAVFAYKIASGYLPGIMCVSELLLLSVIRVNYSTTQRHGTDTTGILVGR